MNHSLQKNIFLAASRNNDNNNNKHDDIYSAVIMTEVIVRVHSVHLVPPTLRPSQMTWAVSPPVLGSYRPQPPSPFIIIFLPTSISPKHIHIPKTILYNIHLNACCTV